MLRIYCLQQWYSLSDPGAEEALYDIQSMRAFAGLERRHDLTKSIFAAVAEHLAAKGELLRGGTIVDATLIAASPSTKNAAQQRDPEMTSSKKGNQWAPRIIALLGTSATLASAAQIRFCDGYGIWLAGTDDDTADLLRCG